MKAFHLLVGPGTVRPDQFVSGADLGQGIGKGLAAAVGHGVVSHHPVYAIPLVVLPAEVGYKFGDGWLVL